MGICKFPIICVCVSISISVYRKGGALPDGVTVDGERLVFGQALRLKDSGVYECVAKNVVGVGKADFDINITGRQRTSVLCWDHRWHNTAKCSSLSLGLLLYVHLLPPCGHR